MNWIPLSYSHLFVPIKQLNKCSGIYWKKVFNNGYSVHTRTFSFENTVSFWHVFASPSTLNPAFSITENGAIRKRSTEWTLSKETDFEDDLNVFDRKTPFFKKRNRLVWTRRKVACRASTQLVSFLHRTKYVSSLHSQTIFIN